MEDRCILETINGIKKVQLDQVGKVFRQEYNARSGLLNSIRDIYPTFTRHTEYWKSRPDYQKLKEEQKLLDTWCNKKKDEIHEWAMRILIRKEISDPPTLMDIPVERIAYEGVLY